MDPHPLKPMPPDAPLNLNTASRMELRQLPGVGPALVERMVAARPYRSVRELIRVDGIGPKLYARLLPLLTVDAPVAESAPPQAIGPAAWPDAVEPSLLSEAALESAPVEVVTQPVIEMPALETIEAAASETASVEISALQPIEIETPAPETIEAAALEVAPVEISASENEPLPEPEPDARAPETAPLAAPHPPAPSPAKPAPAPWNFHGAKPVSPSGLFDSQGKPLLKQGLHANPRRTATYGLSYKQRRQIVLLGFYAVMCFLLVGLGGLTYAWWRSTTSVASAPSATAPVVVTVVSDTPAPTRIVILPTVTERATQVSATATATNATPLASATFAPTATLLPSATPLPTATPTNTPSPLPSNTPLPTATFTPAPTDTPAPTATPTVPPPPGAGALLFAETFDPPQYYWGVGNTSFSRTAIRDRQLEINVVRAALSYVVGAMPQQTDFVYQATARPGACDVGDHYGLRLRAPDDRNYYLFGVMCDGSVRVGLLLDGQYILLASEPPNAAVKIGVDAVNVLRVNASGDELKFYANDQLLATVTDKTFTRGKFGVYAKSTRTAELTVRFDDVLIWEVK